MESGKRMEKIKELIQNKKVMAAILIVFVCALFIIVFVSSRLGKARQPEHGAMEASNTDSVKIVSTENTKPVEKDTAKIADMELETDAQGNISSVITENGETIDLASNEVETETKADGSISYKLADGSEIVVNQDGTTNINKKEETASKSQPSADINLKETTKTVTVDNSSQGGENISSNKGEENTTGIKLPVSDTQPSGNTAQEPLKPTEPQTPAQTVQEPSKSPESTTPQSTVCQHISTAKKVSVAATASSEGTWEKVCTNCGQVLETGAIHPYGAYEVDLGNGQTATIYGYYDNEVADEVYSRLNTYRQENGLNTLERVFDEQSKIRVVECVYDFGHIRPNGTELGDMHKYLFGENCSQRVTGLDTAQAFMDGLKASPGHNSNMLDSDCTMCGISVFHRIDFDEYGIPFSNMAFMVQHFGFEW